MRSKVQAKKRHIRNPWWGEVIMILIFLGLFYGLVSLALNSGSLLEYAAGLFFFGWALQKIVHDTRAALHK